MNITLHAEDRMHERLGIPKKAMLKQAERAFVSGKTYKDFAGRFRGYLDGISREYKNANNLRVFNGFIYLFNNEHLITVWIVPPKFRKAAHV